MSPTRTSPGDVGGLWSSPCMDHDQLVLQPQVVATHLPHTVGGAPQQAVVFTEMQVNTRRQGINCSIFFCFDAGPSTLNKFFHFTQDIRYL